MDILQYQFITPYSICYDFICTRLTSPLPQWYLNGKLAENPVVEPSTDTQVILPTARNRYLESVTVLKTLAVYETSVAVGGTVSYQIDNAATAQSETTATATVAVSNNIVTVTGVAAGTTTVRVYDATSTLVGLIIVTVA